MLAELWLFKFFAKLPEFGRGLELVVYCVLWSIFGTFCGVIGLPDILGFLGGNGGADDGAGDDDMEFFEYWVFAELLLLMALCILSTLDSSLTSVDLAFP